MAKRQSIILVLGILVLAGCAQEQPRYVYAQPHCYRTLAEVDCHAAPLVEEANRKVGYYQAPLN